jgi:hypothetical protein
MEETTKPVDRETLYNEVWAEPVSIVAPRYGLSDVGFAKICRALTIPLPSRGYWAKVKAGRIMGRAPLPKLKESEPVTRTLVKLPAEQVATREATKELAARIRRETPPVASPEQSSTPSHPLVRAASKRLHQRDGWPEGTLARSAPKEVVNFSVTRDAFDRALGIVDALLKALASQGFDIEIDRERGMTLFRWRETGTTLEFALTEHISRTAHESTPAEERAEKRYWERSSWDTSLKFLHIPRYDYTPTGVLTIQVGRWPSKSWKDTAKTKLEQRLGEITAGTLVLVQETHAKELEEARRKEAHRRAEAHYEFLTSRRAEETARFESLEASANNWERATRLRAFADAMEEKAKATGEISTEQTDWLQWVRVKADWLDPFVLVSDPILDAPELKRPSY